MPDTGDPFFLPYPDLADLADFQPGMQNLAQGTAVANSLPWPRMYRSKTVRQDCSSAAFVPILWDAESTANPSTPGISYLDGSYTVDRAGVYEMSMGLHCAVGVATTVYLRLRCVDTVIAQVTDGGMANSFCMNMVKAWRMKAGDTMTIDAYFTAFNSSNYFYGSTTPYSWCDMYMIAT